MLEVLIEGGINIVSTANNHAMDYGATAIEQQIEILDACGIGHCGAGHDYLEAAAPAYIRAGEMVVGIVAMDTETPLMAATGTTAGIAYTNEECFPRFAAAVMAEARAHADLVVVTPHWGNNWVENPPAARRAVARQMIELGADAVLGHSAHILQGVEIHQERPIIYDMGSLLNDRVNQNRIRYSALVELSLDRSGAQRMTLSPVRLRPGRACKAVEHERGYICDLLTSLSHELDPNLSFQRDGESLSLDLNPLPRGLGPALSPPSARLYERSRRCRISDFYRELKTNVVHPKTPERYIFEEPVPVNKWLSVEGARIKGPVRPGPGFGCEVMQRYIVADVDRVGAQQIPEEVNLHGLFLDVIQDRFFQVLGPDPVISRVMEPPALG